MVSIDSRLVTSGARDGAERETRKWGAADWGVTPPLKRLMVYRDEELISAT
ncbi:Hypothetical protein SMAX5B_017760, partial [Scophthalmus maximus]